MVRSTSARPMGSSMAVGSSSTMHRGCMAMTPAMATRCFCPPESRWGACSRYSYMPTAFRASSTRRRISSGGTPRFSGAKATSSSTTLATIWLSGFWNTMPTVRRMSSSRVLVGGVHAVHIHLARRRAGGWRSSAWPGWTCREPLWPSTATKEPCLDRPGPPRPAPMGADASSASVVARSWRCSGFE